MKLVARAISLRKQVSPAIRLAIAATKRTAMVLERSIRSSAPTNRADDDQADEQVADRAQDDRPMNELRPPRQGDLGCQIAGTFHLGRSRRQGLVENVESVDHASQAIGQNGQERTDAGQQEDRRDRKLYHLCYRRHLMVSLDHELAPWMLRSPVYSKLGRRLADWRRLTTAGGSRGRSLEPSAQVGTSARRYCSRTHCRWSRRPAAGRLTSTMPVATQMAATTKLVVSRSPRKNTPKTTPKSGVRNENTISRPVR